MDNRAKNGAFFIFLPISFSPFPSPVEYLPWMLTPHGRENFNKLGVVGVVKYDFDKST